MDLILRNYIDSQLTSEEYNALASGNLYRHLCQKDSPSVGLAKVQSKPGTSAGHFTTSNNILPKTVNQRQLESVCKTVGKGETLILESKFMMKKL